MTLNTVFNVLSPSNQHNSSVKRMLILTGMFQSFILPDIKTFKKMTLRKFDIENCPLQCEFVFGGITVMRQRPLLLEV